MKNRLLVPLIGTVLALLAASAPADDLAILAISPLSELTGQQVLAARQMAKQHWSRMTPDERAVAKKAARHKGPTERTAMDEYALDHRTFDERFDDAHRQDREGSTKRKRPPTDPR